MDTRSAIGAGAALGLAFGVAAGQAGLGIALGVALGAAISVKHMAGEANRPEGKQEE